MRKNTSFKPVVLSAVIAGSLFSAHAGSFSTDFNSGLPPGTAIYANAAIVTNGGYTNSGYLQLTPAVNSQHGSLIITNDLDAGTPVVSFTASWKMFIGGGNGADGVSFSFAPDLPVTGTGFGVAGSGTGLTVEFVTYNNAASEDGPAIDIRLFGSEVAHTVLQDLRTAAWVDTVVQLNPNGSLDVVYDGAYIYSNLDLTAFGYSTNSGYPAPGSLFGFGATTGGLNDNQFIDALNIATQTNAAPYVLSYAPLSRTATFGAPVQYAQTNSTIDIVLTNNTTAVNTNTIAVKLDGLAISPRISQDTNGDTFVHYAPLGGFAYSSTHTVNLAFADNSSPTPRTNHWQYGFTVIAPPFVLPGYVTVFSDGFEAYVSGAVPLDKNYAGANAAPNGSGNPWFGPAPPNALVVGAQNGVTPHGGTNMITGHLPNDGDEDWYNISYRLRGENPIYGNLIMDWWFYDPSGPGDSTYGDYAALGFYNLCPTNTDYVNSGSLNASTQIQRVSLGAGVNQGNGFDNTKYQCRVVGSYGFASGWDNTLVTRSVGWHEGRIIAGPVTNGMAGIYFYIDDMATPAYVKNSSQTWGFNVMEINTADGATLGYFDDFKFGLAVPPNLSVTQSGNNVVLAWPGGFTLQSASKVQGVYSDVPGAISPLTNNITSSPAQFYRLRN
ncbi:MAG TPA: hypothetical protein VFC44_23925 [Candidatus Saccharimonadales bacterium]|nr:hypothetical protein [Candidatus Saccharimonadales bacterium]